MDQPPPPPPPFNPPTGNKSANYQPNKYKVPCPFDGCNRLFVCDHNCNQHIREAHTKERPYVCPENHCKSAFARLGSLNRHIRLIHHKNPSWSGRDGASPAGRGRVTKRQGRGRTRRRSAATDAPTEDDEQVPSQAQGDGRPAGQAAVLPEFDFRQIHEGMDRMTINDPPLQADTTEGQPTGPLDGQAGSTNVAPTYPTFAHLAFPQHADEGTSGQQPEPLYEGQGTMNTAASYPLFVDPAFAQHADEGTSAPYLDPALTAASTFDLSNDLTFIPPNEADLFNLPPPPAPIALSSNYFCFCCGATRSDQSSLDTHPHDSHGWAMPGCRCGRCMEGQDLFANAAVGGEQMLPTMNTGDLTLPALNTGMEQAMDFNYQWPPSELEASYGINTSFGQLPNDPGAWQLFDNTYLDNNFDDEPSERTIAGTKGHHSQSTTPSNNDEGWNSPTRWPGLDGYVGEMDPNVLDIDMDEDEDSYNALARDAMRLFGGGGER
ncbi:uncharacterized protein LTR77_007204 [Saxophila tyrrhenica]|uniref:C2H2-type domain-containing protein n=1 Tax=Saxophila tyrrhenica TaxID=1690608 RepID=A0AAV9P4R0_9PEZI|nr:hypothetical protein LTR77_007204 [Saxophila tyrrhenica]